MIEFVVSAEFDKWQGKLRDKQAKARIAARLGRVADGNLGDVKPVGDGVSELRIPYGPGYRVYFQQRGETIILLLCGGDKSSQGRDIERAKAILTEYEKQLGKE